MALRNDQYEAIMREYSRRQAQARLDLSRRREALFKKLPALAQIEEDTASLSVARAKCLMDGDEAGARLHKEQLRSLAEEKAALLAAHGLSSDCLAPSYVCPDCQDTGYIGSRKCHCFRQAEIDLLYAQSNLKEALQRENFSAFREDYYSEDFIDPDTGQSSRAAARHALVQAKHFVDAFGREHGSLFLYGNTGIGKTFLSNCIAGELLKRSRSVIYFSSYQLFDLFARSSFSRAEDADDLAAHVFGCDLLIVDDLGSELVNSFVSAQLFLLVNERLLRQKSTIISTNLMPENFMNTYSERTFSRIASSYTMIKLFGDDIRLRKRFFAQKP